MYFTKVPDQMLCVVLIMTLLVKSGHSQSQKDTSGGSTGSSQPEQIHLTYGDTVTEMVIMWSTEAEGESLVKYGQGYFNTKYEAEAVTEGLMDGTGEVTEWIHRAVLKELTPGSQYFYKVLTNKLPSDVKTFRVPPSGIDWSPKFLVVGDFDAPSSLTSALTTEAQTGEYAALIMTGDMTTNLQPGREMSGDEFMKDIEPMISILPYLVTSGNHDGTLTDDYLSQYRYRFSNPRCPWPIPDNELWYSFDIGPIHFISFNTGVFFLEDDSLANAQHNFIHLDLEKANQDRQFRPWIIAIGHRPMYCYNDSDADTIGADCALADSKVRSGLEDTFFQHSVDLILNGHGSDYERYWPQFKSVVHAENYTDPTASVQVTLGAGGGELNITGSDPAVAYTTGNSSTPSYGRLTIHNATHLHWELVAVNNESVIDEIWLTQEEHGDFITISPEEEVIIDEIIEVDTSTAFTPVSNTTESPKTFLEKAKDIIIEDQAIVIGVGSAVVVFVVLCCICMVVRCRRRKRPYTRRWERLDYDKSFYSDVKTAEDDDDDDFNDSEIPLNGHSSLTTSKLLSAKTAV